MLKALRAAAALVLLVPTLVVGQVKAISDFSGGLNTRNAGILLQDNESPNLQNVVIDKNGGVSRREGFSKINTAPIGGGISDVNASYQLEQSGGNKYCISFSSTNGYFSTDGCATNSVFISTLSRNNDVNCDPYGDRLYCVNNQYNFAVNGTDDYVIASAPSDLNFIRVFRNRCFGAGKDTNPSRLYWSNFGTCETWTTATDFVDIDAEDGDVITGIGPDLFNFLTVYKKFSTYLLQFDNANSTNRKVINVSRSIGAKNHRAISNYNNKQYFLSVGANGGQPGVYSTDGIHIEEDTGKLRGSIDVVSNFFSNVGRETIDTSADWTAGAFDQYAMSATRDAGFMQSSYTAATDTLSTDWSAGTLVNLSTTDVSGSLVLTSSTIRDDFDDGNLASGQSTWTVTAGSFGASGGGLVNTLAGGTAPSGLLNSVINTVSAINAGLWTFNWLNSGPDAACFNAAGGICFSFRFIANGADYYAVESYNNSGPGTSIGIYKYVGGVKTALSEDFGQTFTPGTTYNIKIARRLSGVMDLRVDGVFKSSTTADTSITASDRVEIAASYFRNQQFFDDLYFYQYATSGTFTSRIRDTAISAPIGGPFSSTFTVNTGNTQIDFFTRQSTSPNNDNWTSFAATSDTLRIPMSLRYQQQQARFYTNTSSTTPRLDAAGFVAASTGTWMSPELFLSNSITNWGLFQAERTLTGSSATISYQLKISSYVGGTVSTGSVTVTPGGTIAHSTGTYVRVLSYYHIYSASETAKDDSVVINWTEGTAAKSATMAVYKNRLHVCGQTPSSTNNDVCFVRDRNGAWVKWTGINARHLNVVGQNFYATGSSETAGGFIYKLYDTDSDAGQPISAYYESKDLVLNDKIQNIKSVDRIYLLGSNDATTLTTTIKADAGLHSVAYDLNLSTGAPFKIIQKPVVPALNGNTYRLRFENNAASKPWSVYGFGLLFRDLGVMP